MEKDKTPDEILEEQRAERTREYAANMHSLHLKQDDLEAKIKNLEKTLTEAFANRKEEIDSLENEVRARMADFDNRNSELAAVKKEADAKLKQAEEILNKASLESITHQDNLDNHLKSVDEIKADLASQYVSLNEQKSKISSLNEESEYKLKNSLLKEQEIEEKANQLVHISENINDDIKKQKELYEKNRLQMEELKSLNAQAIILRNKNSEDLANVIIIRDSLDAEKKSQINRKLEISQREEELQQKNVKCALDLQRLQDKEKEINGQMGKLNELKNNVESLMKLQEKES